MLEPRIKRFKDNRFIYRVFVRKANREIEEQKQAAIGLVKEVILRKQSHLLTKENKMSKSYKHSFNCSFPQCSFKSMIMLICTIENGLHDNITILKEYSGFMIFNGTSGTHRSTLRKEFKVMSGFMKVIGIYENHNIPRNNLAGIPIIKKYSCYKNPVESLCVGDDPKLKFGLKEIPEVM